MGLLDQPRKLHIDLDLSKNSRLKDMFRQPEFHREIQIYLRQHGLEISDRSPNPKGRITAIALAGSEGGLRSFIGRYLSADAFGICYQWDECQSA